MVFVISRSWVYSEARQKTGQVIVNLNTSLDERGMRMHIPRLLFVERATFGGTEVLSQC